MPQRRKLVCLTNIFICTPTLVSQDCTQTCLLVSTHSPIANHSHRHAQAFFNRPSARTCLKFWPWSLQEVCWDYLRALLLVLDQLRPATSFRQKPANPSLVEGQSSVPAKLPSRGLACAAAMCLEVSTCLSCTSGYVFIR